MSAIQCARCKVSVEAGDAHRSKNGSLCCACFQLTKPPQPAQSPPAEKPPAEKPPAEPPAPEFLYVPFSHRRRRRGLLERLLDAIFSSPAQPPTRAQSRAARREARRRVPYTSYDSSDYGSDD